MYKWPQGKVIRTIILILSVLVAVDLGIGAYGAYDAGLSNEDGLVWALIIKCALYGIVALAVFIIGVRSSLFNEKGADFLIDVEQEATKVTLPKRHELVRSTAIIAIGTVVMALVLAVVDIINNWILDIIHGLGA